MSAINWPTVPGRFAPGRFAAITGEVSVTP